MIQELKKGISLLPYAHRCKTSILGMIFIYLMGLASEIMQPCLITGDFLLLMGGIWVTQLLYSFGSSEFVLSSGFRKTLLIKVPVICVLVVNLISYTLFILLLKCYQMKGKFFFSEYFENTVATDNILIAKLIFSGLIIMLLCMYLGITYKHFAVGTALYISVYMILIMMGGLSMDLFAWGDRFMSYHISFGSAALIGYGLIFASAVVQYGLNVLLYKKPVSKYAQYQGLRKEMK